MVWLTEEGAACSVGMGMGVGIGVARAMEGGVSHYPTWRAATASPVAIDWTAEMGAKATLRHGCKLFLATASCC
jgi:hypothetical protein